MPPIKLSKISFPPPKPKPAPPPGLPTAPPPAPAPPSGDDPVLGGGGLDPTLPDLPVPTEPVSADPVSADPVSGGLGETFDPLTAQRIATAAPVDVEVPSELVDKVWRAVETVPGLTIATALTLALQQFLASLPEDYEREAG